MMSSENRDNGAGYGLILREILHDKEDEYTVEEAIDYIGVGSFQYIMLTILIVGWTIDTMEILVLSVLSPELRCDWNLSLFQESSLTTVTFLGMTLFSSSWGKISDKFGRIVQLRLTATCMFFFGLLCAGAPTYYWILILRTIIGGLIAGLHQGIPLIPEFVPRSRRGTFVWLLNISYAVGGVFAVGVAWPVIPRWGWRVYLAICAIPASIFSLLCLWLPETPFYYVSSGRPYKAMSVLDRISRQNGGPLPPGSLDVNVVAERRGEYKELISTPKLTKMSLILPFLWFNCSFVLYGAIFLSTSVLRKADPCTGYTNPELKCHDACTRMDDEDYLSLFVISFADVPGIVIGSFTIDVFGRKPLLVGGALMSSIGSGLLMTCWNSRIFTTICLFVARGAINITFITLFAYTPEVYPTRIRGLSLGVCNGTARLGGALTPVVAQVLSAYRPQLAMFIYAVSAFISCILCLFLPETKGKPITT